MRLRTKLILTGIIMVVLPLLLMVAAYNGISRFFYSGAVYEATDVPSLLTTMFVALALILIITAFLLILWVRDGFFKPIDDLSAAMRHIRDGELDFSLAVAGNEENEVAELYQTYEDMRLRRKESADEKLHHEQQNKELISNISHDLKTPITAIKGYAEGLLEGVADTPDKQMRYVRTIFNKAVDMDKLINELTLYSSIDSDRVPYNFHVINVAEYFGDCVEEVGTEMESRNIRINYSNLTPPDTEVIADAEQIKRVVNNIIGNSVKYLERDDGTGLIEIRILDEVDSVRIEIEDNGKGIAAKDIPHIFDRFYRTDTARGTKIGGSGIGLSIVKKIIEDHGGYIWATSHEGEGTCMHLVLRKYLPNYEEQQPGEIVMPEKDKKKRKK